MSPNIDFVISVVAASTAGSIGSVDFGNSGSVGCVFVILIPVSAITRASVARTSAELDVGTMRQFTFAVADCGSALYACPPASRVATHVVRNIDAYRGSLDRNAAAAESFGLATIARIAAAISGFSTFAVCSKNARVVALSATGNENFGRRASASA